MRGFKFNVDWYFRLSVDFRLSIAGEWSESGSSKSHESMVEESRKGFEAYMNRDFEVALAELTPLSKVNNVYAQQLLAGMYYFGEGVEQDYKRVFELLVGPVEAGIDISRVMLGTMYADGLGIEKDYEAAFDLYYVAARNKFIDGYFYLGRMYLRGLGTKKDYAKARKCFIMAREKRHPEAQNYLNVMDDKGLGESIMSGSVDYARKYADLFAYSLSRGGGYNGPVNVFAYCGGDIDKLISLAEAGYAEAQFNLGMRYFDGKDVGGDYKNALKWFHRAANMDNGTAQDYLGMMYAEGVGVSKDIHIAYLWFELAVSNGDFGAVPWQKHIANLPDFDRGKLDEANRRRVAHSKEYLDGWELVL